jgi:hypothetical protein
MENRGVELIGLMQLDNRGMKECLIRAIFGPSIVPFVDVGVMEFIALGFELIPLHAGMQDIQNVVKDFVEREFWLWPCFGSLQMEINVSVKIFTRDFGRYPIVDKRKHRGVALGIPCPILPDEGG